MAWSITNCLGLIPQCCRSRCFKSQDEVVVLSQMPGGQVVMVGVENDRARNVSRLARVELNHVEIKLQENKKGELEGEKEKQSELERKNKSWNELMNKNIQETHQKVKEGVAIGSFGEVFYLEYESEYPLTTKCISFFYLLNILKMDIFKAKGISAFVVDPSMICYASTKNACLTLGCTPNELIGFNIQELTPTALMDCDFKKNNYNVFKNITILRKIGQGPETKENRLSANLYIIPYHSYFVVIIHSPSKENYLHPPLNINEYIQAIAPLSKHKEIREDETCPAEHLVRFGEINPVYYLKAEFEHPFRKSRFQRVVYAIAQSGWNKPNQFVLVCDLAFNILAFNHKALDQITQLFIEDPKAKCHDYPPHKLIRQKIFDFMDATRFESEVSRTPTHHSFLIRPHISKVAFKLNGGTDVKLPIDDKNDHIILNNLRIKLERYVFEKYYVFLFKVPFTPSEATTIQRGTFKVSALTAPLEDSRKSRRSPSLNFHDGKTDLVKEKKVLVGKQSPMPNFEGPFSSPEAVVTQSVPPPIPALQLSESALPKEALPSTHSGAESKGGSITNLGSTNVWQASLILPVNVSEGGISLLNQGK